MLAFTSVYFFESRLFNGLRPFGIKNLLARFRRSGSARNASHRLVSPLRLGKSPDFHPGVYGEIPDPPRICWPQPARGGRKAQVRQGLGVRKANAEGCEERLGCGARLGERALTSDADEPRHQGQPRQAASSSMSTARRNDGAEIKSGDGDLQGEAFAVETPVTST
jgi:hypothetical protein